MKFVFYEKDTVETDIIVGILSAENIPHKVKQITIKHYCFSDDEDDDEEIVIYEDAYNITCYTDLIHFDFIKHLAEKQINIRAGLEKSYLKKFKKNGKKSKQHS